MRKIKHTVISEDLATYIDKHRFDAGDTLLKELREETWAALPDWAGMQIPGDQGAFLTSLVAAMGARLVVEIGTFTGTSAICIARGLPAGGHLHCFDISDEFTSIARRYWKKAGLDNRITLHLGPATELLGQLPDQEIDFAFLDADKTGYAGYFEALLPRMRKNGLIAFDNAFRSGRVLDANPDDDSKAINALNQKLARDPRVQASLLTIGDGILLARKL
ncbi:MAG: class I SAM-dependent methyltransferase [Opitutaceae bacterium]